MKTKNLICTILCAFVLLACETWEPNFQENGNLLREQVGYSGWEISAYILSSGRQEPIHPDDNNAPDIAFGRINNDRCGVTWYFSEVYAMWCVFGEGNQITFIPDEERLNRIMMEDYRPTCKSETFYRNMKKVNCGYIRNDTLFLLLDPQKSGRYRAICLTNRE